MSTPTEFCPYVGLDSYSASFRNYFFGRDQDIRLIVSNLYASNLTVLYGASAVGKSSILLAGVVPSLQESSSCLVMVQRDWQRQEFLAEIKLGIKSAVQPLNLQAPLTDADWRLPLDELLSITCTATNRRVILVFDQFEEYFQYHPENAKANSFDGEFARCVNRIDLDAGILIALRDDSISALDRYQTRIPNVLSHALRLNNLNKENAEKAIRGPLEEFNRNQSPERRIAIDDDLVETILDNVRTGKVSLSQIAGKGLSSEVEQRQFIETPYLQLVMTRLWHEMVRSSSTKLTLKLLNEDLKGVATIINTHLDGVMGKLEDESQRELCVGFFDRLVTPSGTKIACSIGDLTEWAERAGKPSKGVKEVLGTLKKERVVREIAPQIISSEGYQYEIFHDVLCRAVLDWCARYNQAKERRQLAAQKKRQTKTAFLQRVFFGLLLVLGVLTAFFGAWGIQKYKEAQVAERSAMVASRHATEESQRAEKAKDDARVSENSARIAAGTAKAQAQLREIVEKQNKQLSKESKQNRARELAASARGKLSTDPEVSGLLALYAVDAYQPPIKEAEEALHEAIGAMRMQRSVLLKRRRDLFFSSSWFAFSPDGQYVAASVNPNIEVFSTTTGLEVSSIRVPNATSAGFDMTISKDNLYLATASGSVVQVWELASPKTPVQTFKVPARQLEVAFSDDGRSLAAYTSKVVFIWNIKNGASAKQLVTESSVDTSFAFSPDGIRAAVTSGSTVSLWKIDEDVPKIELIFPNEGWGRPETYEFSANGDALIVFYRNGAVIRWPTHVKQGDAIKYQSLWRAVGYEPSIASAVLNNEGNMVAFGMPDNTIQVTSIDDRGRIRSIVLAGHPGAIANLSFIADDTQLISIDRRHYIKVWNIKAWGELPSISAIHGSNVAISDDGSRVATQQVLSTQIDVYETTFGRQIASATSSIVDKQFGKGQLVVGEGFVVKWLGDDGTLELFDTRNNRKSLLGRFDIFPKVATSAPTSNVNSESRGTNSSVAYTRPRLLLSRDGRRLIAMDSLGRLRIWQTEPIQQIEVRLDDGLRFKDLVLSSDGKTLVATTLEQNSRLVIWNVDDGRPIHPEIKGMSGKIAISPDGRYLAVSGSNETISTFDLTIPNSKPKTFKFGRRSVAAIAFRPNSTQLIVSLLNNEITLWDWSNGEDVLTLTVPGGVSNMSFNESGTHLIVANNNGEVMGYVLDPKELKALARSRISRPLNEDECWKYLHLKQCPSF